MYGICYANFNRIVGNNINIVYEIEYKSKKKQMQNRPNFSKKNLTFSFVWMKNKHKFVTIFFSILALFTRNRRFRKIGKRIAKWTNNFKDK